jgi:ubiquinone/menaquinone biosynthesis C-methylase UbiE
MEQTASAPERAETDDLHGADPRFVRYYEEESLSPQAIRRFRTVRDKVLGLHARVGKEQERLSVLDVGCGAGTQSFVYAELGHRVYGVDMNQPLIQIACKRAEAANLDGAFRVGDAAALPFEDASFDICLHNQLLEHVPEWQRCLDEAVRVLKRGGVLYVSTTNVVCPVQQEFELPLYSWYPRFVKRRCEQLARTSKPEWANYATYPAVNWFSYWSLRRYLGKLGMNCLDRFDLMDQASLPMMARPVLSLVRGMLPCRMVAYLFMTGTIIYGVKT